MQTQNFTPREIAIYLAGMQNAKNIARTSGKGETAAAAIQKEYLTLVMCRDVALAKGNIHD